LDRSASFEVTGAGTASHTIRLDRVRLATATEINNAIASGYLVQVVVKAGNGNVLGIFGAENVSGSAVFSTSFTLKGDGATNSCDIGSTGLNGSGGWFSIDVKILQP